MGCFRGWLIFTVSMEACVFDGSRPGRWVTIRAQRSSERSATERFW